MTPGTRTRILLALITLSLSSGTAQAETYRLESRVLEIMARLYFFARQIAKVTAANVDVEPQIDRSRETSEGE